MNSDRVGKIALRHSRIGARLLRVMFLALLLGALVFLGVTKLGEWAQNTLVYQRLFSEGYQRRMLNRLQEFVTDNNVSSSDYLRIKIWLSDNVGIGFLYGEDAGVESGYSIRFADRTVAVTPYVTYNGYDQIVALVAAVLALAAALLVIAPFARRISSDITRLSGDMAVIAGGDLSHEVRLKGGNELAELAQSFDEMRMAIAARMERESEAIRANQELIAALSHDLRTPLTKQMSYLELAMSDRFAGDEAGMQECLARVHKATCELKERTEELFSYFLVFAEGTPKERALEEVDGTQVLGTLLADQAEFLRQRGFTVESRETPEGLRLRVYLPGLSRIFDNMTSNILKYAEPTQRVRTYVVVNGDRAFVHFENSVRADAGAREGSNIGCRSASRVAENMGGSLQTEKTGNRYYAILALPTADAQGRRDREAAGAPPFKNF